MFGSHGLVACPDGAFSVGAVYIKTFAEKLKESVLRSELLVLRAYSVSDKGILSILKLVNAAEEMFSKGVQDRLSEIAKRDVQSAGRCLAFTLPTACGFHIIRALEGVVVDSLASKLALGPFSDAENAGHSSALSLDARPRFRSRPE